MDRLKLKSLGPIREADIQFGDLTLLVGPQASGKSILLQLIKLLVDKHHIRRTLEQYGFVWGEKAKDVLDRYFGEGMSGIWTSATAIEFDGKKYRSNFLLSDEHTTHTATNESLFYIPAQRVVCLQNGWPRFFTDYEDEVPYILRYFSEALRLFQEYGIYAEGKKVAVFPNSVALNKPLRDSFSDSIFHNGEIIVDQSGKKRFKLNVAGSSLPFMAWSAGQREFMPLLLSFYWLDSFLGPGKKDGIKYVVIEEPEMGLHPQAIKSVMLQVIDLLSRGFKVIISTHSPVLLEFAWAFNYLKQFKAGKQSLYKLFDLKKNATLDRMFEGLLETKNINTYYFNRIDNKVSVKDISSLDAGSEDTAIAEWGGLSSFSSKAADIIAKLAVNED